MQQLDFERFMTALGECKLDSLIIVEWQKSTQTEKDVPGYEKFLEFLDLRATTTELAPQQTSQKKPHLPFRKSSKFTSPENVIQNVSVYAANNQVKCVARSGQKHNLAYCHAFKAKSLPDKRSFVLEHGLYFNCLKANHTSKKCPSPNCCLKCGKRHHTFLHQDDSNDLVTQDSAEDKIGCFHGFNTQSYLR